MAGRGYCRQEVHCAALRRVVLCFGGGGAWRPFHSLQCLCRVLPHPGSSPPLFGNFFQKYRCRVGIVSVLWQDPESAVVITQIFTRYNGGPHGSEGDLGERVVQHVDSPPAHGSGIIQDPRAEAPHQPSHNLSSRQLHGSYIRMCLPGFLLQLLENVPWKGFIGQRLHARIENKDFSVHRR